MTTVIDATSIVGYAYDLVVFGRFKFHSLKESLALYGLNVNDQKSISFRRSIRGVPKRSTYKYLGYAINKKGQAKSKIVIMKSLKVKAKMISKIGRLDKIKGIQMLQTTFGGIIQFYG